MRTAAYVFGTILIASLCPAQDTVTWHSDLDAARTLAAKEHKPLLVVFRCER